MLLIEVNPTYDMFWNSVIGLVLLIFYYLFLLSLPAIRPLFMSQTLLENASINIFIVKIFDFPILLIH